MIWFNIQYVCLIRALNWNWTVKNALHPVLKASGGERRVGYVSWWCRVQVPRYGGGGRDGLATLASTASQTNVLNLKGICARKSHTLNGDWHTYWCRVTPPTLSSLYFLSNIHNSNFKNMTLKNILDRKISLVFGYLSILSIPHSSISKN